LSSRLSTHLIYYTITNQKIQHLYQPCPYPSALPFDLQFSFSVLKKATMSVRENKADRKPNGDCKGNSLCPSESALPLMLIVACGNQCQGYYGVTVGTTVRTPQRKEIYL